MSFLARDRAEFPFSADRVTAVLFPEVTQNKPVFNDGKWGKATLEVLLAILRSSRERREILFEHHVPCGV
jgi:hypothetical protein